MLRSSKIPPSRKEDGMPKHAAYLLKWSPHEHAYEVQPSNLHNFPHLAPESPAWFSWLEQISSFSFHSRHGHTCTVRKERVQRGDAYWYGYRRQHDKMIKRYLGRTTDLTLA